jgi:hypothetical protein
MATTKKRWPNSCEWARLDSITLARKGSHALVAELERVNDPGLLRAMARAVEAFREIEAKLIACKGEQEETERTT